jgi:hypothetical protein
MPTTTRIEKHKRGFFGWIFLLLFWAFNAVMLFSVLAGISGTAEHSATLTNDAERAGAAIGTALGLGFLLSVWMAGAVILGLFVLFTRGRKVITETTQ